MGSLLNTGKRLHHSLIWKLILTVGITLVLFISIWAVVYIRYQRETLTDHLVQAADRVSNTIRLGTHYAMMLNSRDDIHQIVLNIGQQQDLEAIRIYNKKGVIKYSNNVSDIDQRADIEADGCIVCHHVTPPLTTLGLSDRTRLISLPDGHRQLEIISPIYNSPGCTSNACHVHPVDKTLLGTMSVTFSLTETDKSVWKVETGIIGLAAVIFLVMSGIIVIFVMKFVNRPIKGLIRGTQRIAKGNYDTNVEIRQEDELGLLAHAINQMGKEIGEKQSELNRQRHEYQNLFEQVPCFITVQDRDYRLLRYNQEFKVKFDPVPGDFCFHAYKGRTEKCVPCPVEKTLEDGAIYSGEETGIGEDGLPAHWIVRTSPVRDQNGEIVAAMEMSLDITNLKLLENKLEISESKYQAIFDNIPNPVFVLDNDTLEILDCNDNVHAVYGFQKNELIGTPFLSLFSNHSPGQLEKQIKTTKEMDKTRQQKKSGIGIYVNLRFSPAWYQDKQVLLVTASDITKRLETEQQLNQAAKMATLGEMATGVAHELNQPLSVIKTASSFFIKKLNHDEPLSSEILSVMLRKIDSNVDRASDIINHMRQFARKPDLILAKVQVNDVLKRAYDIFSQQLRLREIHVVFELEEHLPVVKAEAGRLEQVFINLLLNARDAIEEKWAGREYGPDDKKITLKTHTDSTHVVIEIKDTGIGIPEEIIPKLFEPFFTTKEVGKGTGLGLSISYGIIKECGGTIHGENDENGARFIAKIPIAS